jgi:hypothetical protein
MLGSYYAVPPDMYQPPPPATPGWQQAPVPGWGTNPMRAGPKRVGVGQETPACPLGTTGIAILCVGMLLGGVTMGYVYGAARTA